MCFAAARSSTAGFRLTPANHWWTILFGKASKEQFMARTPIRPLGEKVLVKRLEAEETTAGGIVLPDTAKEKPKRGTVLSVGEGRLLDTGERKPLQVAAGQEVLFSSYAGTEVKVAGEEMIIMDEADILAVLE